MMTSSCQDVIEPVRRSTTGAPRPTPRARSRLLFAGLIALGSALAPPARAGDSATADALFEAGKALVAQKKYAEACPKYAASYKLEATLGTLLNLADCHEKQGLVAQAWSEWGEAKEKAVRERDAARADLASRRRAAIGPRVPKLNITIKGDLAGATLFRDGFEIEASMLGIDLPIEPGAHTVTVRRGAQVMKSMDLMLHEGARERVTVDVSDLPAPPPPKAGHAPPAAGMAPRAPGEGGLRIRGGFSVNGGVAFYVGEDTLPEISIAGRIGVQITPLFSIYYQNTPTFQARVDGSAVVFVDYNSLLANVTLAHRVEIGLGPSADVYIIKYAGDPYVEPEGAFGLHGRTAFNIGGPMGAGPRRRAFTVGIDIHPVFLREFVMLGLTTGVGGEWY